MNRNRLVGKNKRFTLDILSLKHPGDSQIEDETGLRDTKFRGEV